MFTDLNVFQLAHAMATHAGKRQTVVARNVANADTPGYKARDLEPFSAALTRGAREFAPRSTRAGHLAGSAGAVLPWAEVTAQTAGADPNGNTVSVEEEMMKAVEVKRQHDRALAIYKSSLTILRTSLGRA